MTIRQLCGIQLGLLFIFSVVALDLSADEGVVDSESWVTLPQYQPGETFLFTNKRVERVEKVTGDLVVFSSRRGHRYVRHRNVVLPIMEWTMVGKSAKRTVYGDAESLWPLAVGKQAGFRVLTTIHDEEKKRDTRHAALWQCHVAALEMIDVTAGQFSSYRIICDHYSEHSMRILNRYTWHYSPAVNHYVRRAVKNFLTGDSHQIELIATLPAAKSNALRVKALQDALNP